MIDVIFLWVVENTVCLSLKTVIVGCTINLCITQHCLQCLHQRAARICKDLAETSHVVTFQKNHKEQKICHEDVEIAVLC